MNEVGRGLLFKTALLFTNLALSGLCNGSHDVSIRDTNGIRWGRLKSALPRLFGFLSRPEG